MYKNLKIEMLKQNITVKDIAEKLQINTATVCKKINCKIGISLNDCILISEMFSTNNSIDYLFKKF